MGLKQLLVMIKCHLSTLFVFVFFLRGSILERDFFQSSLNRLESEAQEDQVTCMIVVNNPKVSNRPRFRDLSAVQLVFETCRYLNDIASCYSWSGVFLECYITL